MKPPRPYRLKRRIVLISFITVVIGGSLGIGAYRYDRPLPALSSTFVAPSATKQTVTLPWTASGESAISTATNKLLGRGPNADKVTQTASIAKLITILTVLKKYPLKAGEPGPTLTMTANDVTRYNYYTAIDGSTVPVVAGETITEYQMIQAMMLPSANNIADSLAIWAYGSLPSYKIAAQTVVNNLGMTRTTVGSDASGFLPDTTSTANDLVLLGQAALKESVVTEIASQRLALFPHAGTIYSTDPVLGQSGITGLKTGTTDQAGDCFLFTATHTFNNGHTETFVGVVLNASTSSSRFTDATTLLEATYANYHDVVIARAGQSVGTVTSAWGQRAGIITSGDVNQFTWAGDAPGISGNVSIGNDEVLDKGQVVGSIDTGSTSVGLKMDGPITAPSFWWRILR